MTLPSADSSLLDAVNARYPDGRDVQRSVEILKTRLQRAHTDFRKKNKVDKSQTRLILSHKNLPESQSVSPVPKQRTIDTSKSDLNSQSRQIPKNQPKKILTDPNRNDIIVISNPNSISKPNMQYQYQTLSLPVTDSSNPDNDSISIAQASQGSQKSGYLSPSVNIGNNKFDNPIRLSPSPTNSNSVISDFGRLIRSFRETLETKRREKGKISSANSDGGGGGGPVTTVTTQQPNVIANISMNKSRGVIQRLQKLREELNSQSSKGTQSSEINDSEARNLAFKEFEKKLENTVSSLLQSSSETKTQQSQRDSTQQSRSDTQNRRINPQSPLVIRKQDLNFDRMVRIGAGERLDLEDANNIIQTANLEPQFSSVRSDIEELKREIGGALEVFDPNVIMRNGFKPPSNNTTNSLSASMANTQNSQPNFNHNQNQQPPFNNMMFCPEGRLNQNLHHKFTHVTQPMQINDPGVKSQTQIDKQQFQHNQPTSNLNQNQNQMLDSTSETMIIQHQSNFNRRGDQLRVPGDKSGEVQNQTTVHHQIQTQRMQNLERNIAIANRVNNYNNNYIESNLNSNCNVNGPGSNLIGTINTSRSSHYGDFENESVENLYAVGNKQPQERIAPPSQGRRRHG